MIIKTFRSVEMDKVLRVNPEDESTDLLTAAMLFPDNKNAQLEYFEKLVLTGSCYPSPESVKSEFYKKIVEGINNGIVAGSCLMYFSLLLNTHIETKARNRLNVSKRVVSYLCKEHNLGRDRKSITNKQGYPIVTEPRTEKIWKDYQRVSHLWAAYIHIALDGNPTLILPQDHVFDSVDISVLLFLARQYERIFDKLTLDEKKGANSVPVKVKPFCARYFDWNSDDVLAMDVPEIDHIRIWATEAACGYEADT